MIWILSRSKSLDQEIHMFQSIDYRATFVFGNDEYVVPFVVQRTFHVHDTFGLKFLLMEKLWLKNFGMGMFETQSIYK